MKPNQQIAIQLGSLLIGLSPMIIAPFLGFYGAVVIKLTILWCLLLLIPIIILLLICDVEDD